jgi:hypothetical protein
MDLPSSHEFDVFVEDDGFELDFELCPESSMWTDDVYSSSLVDESQEFFNIDSDFDLLDDTEPSSLVEDSHNPFKMEVDLESASHFESGGSDSEMSDSEFDTFSLLSF